MNSILTLETLNILSLIQEESEAASQFILPDGWGYPPGCSDCSGGSCSGGCSGMCD